MASIQRPDRVRPVVKTIALQVVLLVATLGALELLLRVADVRYLRESAQILQSGPGSRDLALFRYDDEIGWAPVPNSSTKFHTERDTTISVHHNSLGLRDVENDRTERPTIMVLGDSLVWGNDVETDVRFTEVLRQALPEHRIVNAGVAGYGTDQEYLFLKRIWDRIEPNVVVLVFSAATDRADNTSNARYDYRFKPYFVRSPDGELQLRGQPVPKSRHLYFSDNAIVHASWLARLATSVYLHVRHPDIAIPDPTEGLVGLIRSYVEARSATFVVGLQRHDQALEAFLDAQKIPHTSFDEAQHYYTSGAHWTPEGHRLVAAKLEALLAQSGALQRHWSAADAAEGAR